MNCCQQFPQNISPSPFLRGLLYRTNDPGDVSNALAQGFAVIAVVDVDEAYKFQGVPNVAVMSNLLPPTDSITAFINGDQNNGKALYYQYLQSKDRELSLLCILQALYGKRMRTNFTRFLVYTDFSPDEEFHILEVLTNFLYNTFGIYMGRFGDPNDPSINVENPQFNYIIANILFANGKMTREEYVTMLPLNAAPSDESCAILLRDLNIQPQSLDNALRICCSYINDIRKSISNGKINPVLQVQKCMDQKLEDEISKRVVSAKTIYGNK